MVKPTLLVLAAGMGSRYGSLKQMDGVGPNNEAIIDYSSSARSFRPSVSAAASPSSSSFRSWTICPKALRFPKAASSRGARTMP